MQGPFERLSSALVARYELEREIGAGGMATVYLARDVRHNRRVALKLLKPELGAVLGVERFLAEIEVTANLQHPNLLPLFDSGEVDGLLYYVMPFIDGESLRARLDREKQLPVDDAVRVAATVASALAYAHGHGVVHRDLKPENILLQAGQPLLADFGIALAVSNAGGARITQTGLSLGTPHYMSPEQATGDRTVDGRSDIYSLGCVLFEMLTGDPPHVASTAQAIIAKVLTERPPNVRVSRAAVPEHVAYAIERALEKHPADRWADAREFVEALHGRGTMPAFAAASANASARGSSSMVAWLRQPLVTGALSAAVAGAAVWMVASAASRDASAPVRFTVTAGPGTPRPEFSSTWPGVVSPDGRTLVFMGSKDDGLAWQLYMRRLDALGVRPVPSSEGATEPTFSPDSKWIAFESNGKLRKVELDGQTATVVSNGSGNNGADWTTRNEIILGSDNGLSGLSRVPAAGGTPIEITKPHSPGDELVWPVVLADGKTVLFTVAHGTARAESRIAVGSLTDGTYTTLSVAGIRPLGVFEGDLVYLQNDGVLMAVPVSVGARKVTGSAIPLLDSVAVCGSCDGDSGAQLSRSGTLVYMRGVASRSRMEWMDTNGVARDIIPSMAEAAGPQLSPDGKRIAYSQMDDEMSDIWIYDLASSTPTRLTSSDSYEFPDWSPDGRRIIFCSTSTKSHTTIWEQPADGSGVAEKMVSRSQNICFQSMHGSDVMYSSTPPDGNAVLEITRLGDTGKGTLYTSAAGHNLHAAVFSPDGRWVTYTSDSAGHSEVFVSAYPNPQGRVQVSAKGGRLSNWSPDGKRIFYWSGNDMIAATVTASPSFIVVARKRLFTALRLKDFDFYYDVSRDGTKFLMVEEAVTQSPLVVVTNWLTELRMRTSGR